MEKQNANCFLVNPKFNYGDTVVYHGQVGIVNGVYSIINRDVVCQTLYYVNFGYGLDENSMCREEDLSLFPTAHMELKEKGKMNIKEYSKEVKRTIAKLETRKEDDNHMLMGMVTEVGELIDAYKKHYAYGRALDLTNVQEELGDLMWYIANFCTMNGFDIEQILDRNVNKLKARYPEKFDSHLANNRNLDKERETLEA